MTFLRCSRLSSRLWVLGCWVHNVVVHTLLWNFGVNFRLLSYLFQWIVLCSMHSPVKNEHPDSHEPLPSTFNFYLVKNFSKKNNNVYRLWYIQSYTVGKHRSELHSHIIHVSSMLRSVTYIGFMIVRGWYGNIWPAGFPWKNASLKQDSLLIHYPTLPLGGNWSCIQYFTHGYTKKHGIHWKYLTVPIVLCWQQ